MRRLWILCQAVVLASALATPVYATDIALDDNCTLADAIIAANTDEAVGGCPAGAGADVIRLSADVTLNWDLPPVSSDITVIGGVCDIGAIEFIAERGSDDCHR